MLKLKNFIQDSILKSFNVEVKAPKQVFSTPKKTKLKKKSINASSGSGAKKPKGYFSKGQILKQAKKQGVKISYKLAQKLSLIKQTKEQLKGKIYYQKYKQKAESRKAVLKAQGRQVNVFIQRYRKLLEIEYEKHPTTANLKKLQEASLLEKEAKLLDKRYRQYWGTLRGDIREAKERLRESRSVGNVSKPTPVGRVGTSTEDYVMNNYADRVEELLTGDSDMTEAEAIQTVLDSLVADGTLEPLQQFYDTGVPYGYYDESTDEVISPL